VIGSRGSRPGNSHVVGWPMHHHSRSNSKSRGDSNAVAILLAFALLDAEHPALGVDIRHLEVGDLGYTQAGAIGTPSAALYFGPGAASRSRKTSSVVRNHRQLLRLLHEPEMTGHLRSIAGRREKEPPAPPPHRFNGRRLHAPARADEPGNTRRSSPSAASGERPRKIVKFLTWRMASSRRSRGSSCPRSCDGEAG